MTTAEHGDRLPTAHVGNSAATIQLGDIRIRYVHADAAGPYSLLEWTAPAATQSPPVHIHHRTDEGFYVIDGRYGFFMDDEYMEAAAGSHVLVPKGHPHTFWNAGHESATCLIVLAPAGFENYFRDLAQGLDEADSDDAALDLRLRLSATYDIEVVGPPVGPG
jgi:mannose-6-phosphate isomerase-like protein (cupin superfamily)